MTALTVLAVRPFGLFDTIILFDAVDDRARPRVLAVDHRPARDLRWALAQGRRPRVEAEDWQVIR